jgi:hypothetical protein
LEYWLNIDKPNKICVLHVEGCTFEVRKEVTPLKGIGEIRSDGGWLSFSSHKKAREYFEQSWAQRGYEFSENCKCLNL